MKQSQALIALGSGHNIFLTGSPGAGKTYVLNMFVKQAKQDGKIVAITATTGIAATHLSGTTIHSWSGIGLSSNLQELDLAKLKRNKAVVDRYKTTDILVIDEASMLDSSRLDLIGSLAKLFRKSDQPFGGIQLILVGDLFQLPPVNKDSSVYDFIYKAVIWDELDIKICYLTEQHRQNTEDGLYRILEAMRSGSVSAEDMEVLSSRIALTVNSDELTKLHAHNFDVDQINKAKLDNLDGDEHLYKMFTTGATQDTNRLKLSILAPEELALKEGCEVMFIVNNPKAGYVNGSRGRVVEFKNSSPIVRLTSGKYVEVKRHEWKIEIGGQVVATAEQYPVRLAWAITIHKSQGMSLDAAEVDLSRAFTPGMGYVALSRLRSLDGLYLSALNNMALKVNPDILNIDKQFRQLSDQLIAQLDIAHE